MQREYDKDEVMRNVEDWYELRMWIPIIKQYLYDMYGEDVSKIIMDYYNNIQCDDEVVLMINDIQCVEVSK